MSESKAIELLRRFADAAPSQVEHGRVKPNGDLCSCERGAPCLFCQARAFLAAHAAAQPEPDAVQQLPLRTDLARLLDAPGWPHEYDGNFHKSNCRACEMRRDLKAGRPLLARMWGWNQQQEAQP